MPRTKRNRTSGLTRAGNRGTTGKGRARTGSAGSVGNRGRTTTTRRSRR